MKNHTSQNPNKQKLGVIGFPISHSKSPLIQGHFIDFYGLGATYKAIEIQNLDKLQHFMMQLKQPDWTGVNVTIPYKESVIPYLDWVHDDVSTIGACNTIISKNGQLHGYNTDAEGFYMPLKNKVISNALILGNGGAAKAVLYQCAKEGMRDICLVARNHSKSEACVQRLNNRFNINIKPISFSDLEPEIIIKYGLIVNTTSIGMKPNDVPFSGMEAIGQDQCFYDLIYSPWQTKMMGIAESNGATVLNGAQMLAFQGALAFELFFNKPADGLKMYNLIKKDQ